MAEREQPETESPDTTPGPDQTADGTAQDVLAGAEEAAAREAAEEAANGPKVVQPRAKASGKAAPRPAAATPKPAAPATPPKAPGIWRSRCECT